MLPLSLECVIVSINWSLFSTSHCSGEVTCCLWCDVVTPYVVVLICPCYHGDHHNTRTIGPPCDHRHTSLTASPYNAHHWIVVSCWRAECMRSNIVFAFSSRMALAQCSVRMVSVPWQIV